MFIVFSFILNDSFARRNTQKKHTYLCSQYAGLYNKYMLYYTI